MHHTVYYYVVYVATLRITGAMEKSAEVMKSMQQLVKVGEVAETMREMAKEMMKVDARLRKALMSVLENVVVILM